MPHKTRHAVLASGVASNISAALHKHLGALVDVEPITADIMAESPFLTNALADAVQYRNLQDVIKGLLR